MSSSAAVTAIPRRLRRTRAGAALPRVDGRLRSSRRFKELVETFAKEAGGILSEVDQTLLQQAASLTLAAEMMSADVVGGKPVDADALVRVNSEARRLLETLRAKTEKNRPSQDPLAAHIAAKYGRPAGSEEAAGDQ